MLVLLCYKYIMSHYNVESQIAGKATAFICRHRQDTAIYSLIAHKSCASCLHMVNSLSCHIIINGLIH